MTSEPKTLPALTLGKRIRFLRTQAQLTQDDLAGKLNITRQALSNWEIWIYWKKFAQFLAYTWTN